MANINKARVYAEQLAEQSGLVNECDVDIFCNGFVKGFKIALEHVNSVATKGHILSVIQYCKIDEQ